VKAFLLFDFAELADEYEHQGWMHVLAGAITRRVLRSCSWSGVAAAVGDPLHARASAESKGATVWSSSGVRLHGELLVPMATLARLDPNRMWTISERHVKMVNFARTPTPFPAAQADRLHPAASVSPSRFRGILSFVLLPGPRAECEPAARQDLRVFRRPINQNSLVDAREAARPTG